MLYLEDYLELIEHLPQELRDRLTLIRENDLKVNNSSQQIDTKVKQFFAEAKKLNPEQRQCNYDDILAEYEKTINSADEKLQLADQTSDIMVKLIQKLDGELEKFKLELEADHAGITEQLERRSLLLDADSRLDETINGFLNSTKTSRHSVNVKDRRKSEYRHRHHPYQNNNGYHVRAKLSQNNHDQDGVQNTSNEQHNQMPQNHHQNHISPISFPLFNSVMCNRDALQLQQDRRTPSLKANNFSAINAAGLNHQSDHLGYTNRNALAPMAPDQQAHRYNQQFGKMNSNGTSSPLYISVTKSGRPTKRPKHHTSHLYPDESPASISSDNSVFENSESLSSAEFIHEASPALGSSSPSSYDYNRSLMSDPGGNGGGYQLDQTKYCICRQVSYGGMVACDNEDCEIQWFHFGCVDLSEAPKGKWFCPECQLSISSQPQQKKRGRKEKSAFNIMNSSSHDTNQVKSKERVVSAE